MLKLKCNEIVVIEATIIQIWFEKVSILQLDSFILYIGFVISFDASQAHAPRGGFRNDDVEFTHTPAVRGGFTTR